MARETVLLEIRDGVAIVTWNRPRQRNAFNRQMWCEGRDLLRELLGDSRARAVVVTGAGDAFTAGQDLSEMSAAPGDAEHPFGGFMDVLVDFDKPLLAAVNGVGVGIGLTMLLHCDVVHLAEEARLRAPFVPLGVVPEAAASFMLPLIVGYQRAAEVLYTGDWIDARRALELGLASRVSTRAELLPSLLALAAKMAAGPIGSIRHTKRLLLATRAEQIRAARVREDAGFVERVGTPENMEAIMAFFEKRPPDFSKL
ncbi:MAG: enoyl-CoA hydratase/isomerase family protein [Deltaproteobacteria bacterium]|nr:enoyl-CoA hydratase/isomerase family protein [Deltaproteobacteria bacterium]